MNKLKALELVVANLRNDPCADEFDIMNAHAALQREIVAANERTDRLVEFVIGSAACAIFAGLFIAGIDVWIVK